jgi:type I restriction enzyme S subunit
MVEWKPLYSIVKSISTGLNPRQNFVLNEDKANYYYVTVKEITTNKVVFSDSTDKITEAAKRIINNRSKLAVGDILFSGIGTIGKVAYVDFSTHNWDCSESVFLIKPEEDVVIGKYLSYILSSNTAKSQYERGSAGAIMKGVRKSTLENLQIPVPSLSEQERIVGILDTFTAAIENLKAQIANRRKQYEHYRDQLLDLEGKEGVEMKTLGEVCEFVRGPFGGALKKEIFVESGYAVYEQQHAIYGQWDFRYFIDKMKFQQMKRFEVHTGDILMSCSGTMGKTAIIPENHKEGIINQALLKLSVKKDVCNSYIKLFMDSRWFQEGLMKQTSGGAIQNVASVSILKELGIPLPSLSEQERIVSILDTFEASIANLEAQLKEREKQYEYYRNKLLKFE